MTLKVSIITVSYNAEATILDTLRSVEQQDYPDIEHLVIDGGSKDGTVEIVKTHGRRVAHLVSEPDRGLYDAMNKGLALATGDVVAYLNSDDWYVSPSTVSHAAQGFSDAVDLVYGDLDFVEADPPHAVQRVWRDRQHKASAFAWGWHPAHPSTFMRTALLRQLGGFDMQYGTAADYAMFAFCFLTARASAVHVPEVFTHMRMGGVSTSGAPSVIRANHKSMGALRAAGAPFPALTIALKLARKVTQLRPQNLIWRQNP